MAGWIVGLVTGIGLLHLTDVTGSTVARGGGRDVMTDVIATIEELHDALAVGLVEQRRPSAARWHPGCASSLSAIAPSVRV